MFLIGALIYFLGFSSVPVLAGTTPCRNVMTVGTQNLWHYPNDYEDRKDNLQTQSNSLPDVIGVQEAWSWVGVSLFRDLANLYGSRFYFSETNRWPGFLEGLAVASRFPIRERFFEEIPHSSMINRRGIQFAKILGPRGPFWFLNTHLSPFDARDERRDQVRYIQKRIQKISMTETVFIVGDMNDEFSSGIFKPILDEGFVPLQGMKRFVTYSKQNKYSQGPFESALDHVFLRSRDYQIVGAELIFNKKVISDHYGLKVYLCY